MQILRRYSIDITRPLSLVRVLWQGHYNIPQQRQRGSLTPGRAGGEWWPKRCRPLEGACQLGYAFRGAGRGNPVLARVVCRSRFLLVAVRPGFESGWCQSTTAPATHRDQGGGERENRLSGPRRRPAPHKVLELCRLYPRG